MVPIVSVLLLVMMGIVNICTGMCVYGSDDVCSLINASLAAHEIWVLSMHTSALHRLPHLITGTNNRASLEYLVVVVSMKFFVFFLRSRFFRSAARYGSRKFAGFAKIWKNRFALMTS